LVCGPTTPNAVLSSNADLWANGFSPSNFVLVLDDDDDAVGPTLDVLTSGVNFVLGSTTGSDVLMYIKPPLKYNAAYKAQTVLRPYPIKVWELLREDIDDTTLDPPFVTEVMEPLQIEQLMD
ncbi:hypothetical protein Tco_1064803, partial [Tanacetum coccineum]